MTVDATPWVLSYEPPPSLPSGLPQPEHLHGISTAHVVWHQLLNAANALSFGDIHMPGWVQLDCCTLPLGIVGFAAEVGEVPLWRDRLLDSVDKWMGADARAVAERQDRIPISAYCALPTAVPGRFVGVSLWSGVRGFGRRTKAYALSLWGVRELVGVTQYANRAIATHASLAPCEIIATRAVGHTQASSSFVYRQLLDAEKLLELARGGQSADRCPRPDGALLLPIDDDTPDMLDTLATDVTQIIITAPGIDTNEDGVSCLVLLPHLP